MIWINAHGRIAVMSSVAVPLAAALFTAVAMPAQADAADDDYGAIFEQALSSVERSYQKNWTFTETKIEDGTTVEGHYDPRRSDTEHWQLVSVDGRAPTSSEIEEFMDGKEKDRKKALNDEQGDGARGKRDISKMVQRDSLTLLEESDESWLFSFIPEDDDGEFSTGVEGTLKILKSGKTMDYLEMKSREPFKPAFGVKIYDFYTHLAFEPYDVDGPVLLRAIQIRVSLRAFLVAKVNKDIRISLTDFQFVGNDDGIKSRMVLP